MYNRFKIEFKLKTPVILNKFSCFDSIFAKSILNFLPTAPDPSDFNYLNDISPFRKILYKNSYIHAVSIALYKKTSTFYSQSYTQAATLNVYMPLFNQDTKLSIASIADQRSGSYRPKLYKLSPLVVDKVSFVADVLTEEYEGFETVCKSIKYIGKKKSLGFGAVAETIIEETNEPIVRPIPLDLVVDDKQIEINYNEPIISTTIIPPYWKGERVLCTIATI